MQGMNFRFSLHRAIGRMRMHVQAAAEGFAPCQVSEHLCACAVLCSGPHSLAPMQWPLCMLRTSSTVCAPAGAWLCRLSGLPAGLSAAQSLLRVALTHDVVALVLHKPSLE